MQWVNFLHLYQPVHTDAHFIKEATDLSYTRIIKALEEHPHIKFTLNITGCLVLRWEELGYVDLIIRLGKLLKKGQIELVDTVMYHPLIPLIPKKEVINQIKENQAMFKKYFGANYKPAGFFFPEMAYSPEAAKLVKALGYKWIILDEIAFNGKLGQADFTKKYIDKNSGLKVILRSRKISDSYVPKTINTLLNGKKTDLVITATDGELYGLRHHDQAGIFERLLKRKELETITVSDFVNDKSREEVEIKPKSHHWNISEEEYQKGEAFNLWQDKTNKVQKKIWELANLAYDTIEKNNKDKNYYWARWHMVRGLVSCTFWWASAKDFKEQFGPISWNPDEIERGVNELIRSIRALEDVASRETKVKAEKLYVTIKKLVWERHWRYYWKK